MAVNRKLPTERLNLDPGLKGKTKFEEQSHLKRFWNDSQRVWSSGFRTGGFSPCVKLRSNIVKFRRSTARKVAFECWPHSSWPARGSKASSTACKLLTSFRGRLRDVVGCAGRIYALVAADQEGPFEEPGALVVQEVFVPTALHQFGNDHDNLPVGVFLC
jgi:hypothetical protein